MANAEQFIGAEIEILKATGPENPGPSGLPKCFKELDLESPSEQRTNDPDIQILENTDTKEPEPFEIPEWMQKIMSQEDDFLFSDIPGANEVVDDLDVSMSLFGEIADNEKKDNVSPLLAHYSPISPASTPPGSRPPTSTISPDPIMQQIDLELAASALDHKMPKRLCEGAVSNTAEALLLELRTLSEWSNNKRDSDESESDESESDKDNDTNWSPSPSPKKRKRYTRKSNGCDPKRRKKS